MSFIQVNVTSDARERPNAAESVSYDNAVSSAGPDNEDGHGSLSLTDEKLERAFLAIEEASARRALEEEEHGEDDDNLPLPLAPIGANGIIAPVISPIPSSSTAAEERKKRRRGSISVSRVGTWGDLQLAALQGQQGVIDPASPLPGVGVGAAGTGAVVGTGMYKLTSRTHTTSASSLTSASTSSTSPYADAAAHVEELTHTTQKETIVGRRGTISRAFSRARESVSGLSTAVVGGGLAKLAGTGGEGKRRRLSRAASNLRLRLAEEDRGAALRDGPVVIGVKVHEAMIEVEAGAPTEESTNAEASGSGTKDEDQLEDETQHLTTGARTRAASGPHDEVAGEIRKLGVPKVRSEPDIGSPTTPTYMSASASGPGRPRTATGGPTSASTSNANAVGPETLVRAEASKLRSKRASRSFRAALPLPISSSSGTASGSGSGMNASPNRSAAPSPSPRLESIPTPILRAETASNVQQDAGASVTTDRGREAALRPPLGRSLSHYARALVQKLRTRRSISASASVSVRAKPSSSPTPSPKSTAVNPNSGTHLSSSVASVIGKGTSAPLANHIGITRTLSVHIARRSLEGGPSSVAANIPLPPSPSPESSTYQSILRLREAEDPFDSVSRPELSEVSEIEAVNVALPPSPSPMPLSDEAEAEIRIAAPEVAHEENFLSESEVEHPSSSATQEDLYSPAIPPVA